MTDEAHNGGWWRNQWGWPWSADRWIAIVGVIAGVLVGWYFYQRSLRAPLLTYMVNPATTTINRQDFEQDFGFTYQGKPLAADRVTAVQVAIWNSGTDSIRAENVLSPVTLKMTGGERIISAKVRKVSRGVCLFDKDDNPEQLERGVCPVKWKILEPNDGAIIQLIYLGDSIHVPTIEGTIEGQSRIRIVPSEKNGLKWSETVPIIVVSIVPFLVALKIGAKFRKRKPIQGLIFTVGYSISTGVAIVLLLWLHHTPTIPFGW